MEQNYSSAPAKRFTQNRMFKNLSEEELTLLGLGGPEPEEYIKTLPESVNKTILVDTNPSRDWVEHTTLVEGYTRHRTEVNFVDCDFCSTIWSNIEDFKHIYTEMKKQNRTQYLAITVSLRQVGMRRTLEYLAQFEEFGITKEDCKEIQSHRVASSKDLKHERSHVHRLCKGDKALNIYSYSDTGTPMLAGIIKIN